MCVCAWVGVGGLGVHGCALRFSIKIIPVNCEFNLKCSLTNYLMAELFNGSAVLIVMIFETIMC